MYVASGAAFTMTGGVIRGNSANQKGGGVYVNTTGTFTKTGGTIYGSGEGGNSNTAGGGATNGHAVYYNNGAKYRDTTSGSGHAMSATGGVGVGFDN